MPIDPKTIDSALKELSEFVHNTPALAGWQFYPKERAGQCSGIGANFVGGTIVDPFNPPEMPDVLSAKLSQVLRTHNISIGEVAVPYLDPSDKRKPREPGW